MSPTSLRDTIITTTTGRILHTQPCTDCLDGVQSLSVDSGSYYDPPDEIEVACETCSGGGTVTLDDCECAQCCAEYQRMEQAEVVHG